MFTLLLQKCKQQLELLPALFIWCLMMFVFSFSLYRMYDEIILDVFYVFVDGYNVDAYITKSEYPQKNSSLYVEMHDVEGRDYKITYSWSNRTNIKEQEEKNKIGKHVIIRRSVFLNKWNFWKRGAYSFFDLIFYFLWIGGLGYTILMPIMNLFIFWKYKSREKNRLTNPKARFSIYARKRKPHKKLE